MRGGRLCRPRRWCFRREAGMMTTFLFDPLERTNSLTTVCAKTIVARRMPRMNRMWKVAVMS
jgi:hypothetical protein